MKYFVCVLVAIFFCNTLFFSINETEASYLKIPEPLPFNKSIKINEIKNNESESKYYNIPVIHALQDFIRLQCETYNISETMFYGIIKTESDFELGVISNTNDHGLVQININTFNWLNEKYFNNKLNIKSESDRITASIFYLNYIRDYWRNKGLCDEEVFKLTILSYHLGINGATKFVKKHGYNSKYLKEVIEFKMWLETEGKEVSD